ncbi:MAG: response regulator transcription factor [Ilumatobacteraceae bacterium]
MVPRILIVEDDESIGRAVSESLASHGYLVDWCLDGESVAALIDRAVPDLVLLDAGLPDIDGFTLCRWLRGKHRDLPIVLVTARDAEIDIVVGLDAGASDYVTKPFSMNILLARVRAHLRGAEAADSNAAIELGELRVDPAAYVATVAGQPIDLRRREFELLVLLCREAGRVATRERLLSEIWDLHWESSTKTLDMHVMALRHKLGEAIDIVTVRGVGYRLVIP